jgi:hypothetical protein
MGSASETWFFPWPWVSVLVFVALFVLVCLRLGDKLSLASNIIYIFAEITYIPPIFGGKEFKELYMHKHELEEISQLNARKIEKALSSQLSLCRLKLEQGLLSSEREDFNSAWSKLESLAKNAQAQTAQDTHTTLKIHRAYSLAHKLEKVVQMKVDYMIVFLL